MVIIRLWEMSLLGTFFIFIVIAIRKISMKRIPYNLIIILWQVILIRLLVPFALPNSLNLVSKIEQIKPVIYINENIKTWSNDKVMYNESLKTNIQREEKKNSASSLYKILQITWFAGTISLVLFFMIYFYFSYSFIREAIPIKGNASIGSWLAKTGNHQNIYIMESDRISTPITSGIFAAKIILPKGINYSEKELEYILTHEMIHIRYFHVLWKRIIMLILCIHWFNPIVWVMYFLFNKDLEIACDEKVIKQLGDTERENYALTILRCASEKSSSIDVYGYFGKNYIQERIVCIMRKRNKSFLITICVMGVGLVSTCIFATTFTQTPHESIAKSQQFDKNVSTVFQQTFEEYEPYGLMYDKESTMYFYKGKSVKFFYDRLNPGKEQYKMFTNPKGEVNVKAIRNAKNNLVTLELVGEKELGFYNNLDSKNNEEQLNTQATKTNKTPQANNPKSIYQTHGITYNEHDDAWEINGTVIALLYDKGYHTYFNNSKKAIKEGLRIKVIRDKNNVITGFANMTEEEIAALKWFNPIKK